ncbi:hypothetical protein GBA52_010884 [Prunus armeniaca]|nr:hypothetical protein GBA52_010884 [Prunus armeniaca]
MERMERKYEIWKWDGQILGERKANGVATRLAHYALHSQEAAEWVTDPPVFLQDVLFSDVM